MEKLLLGVSLLPLKLSHTTKAWDGISISYMDLEKSFGRGGFKALNDKLQIFDISTNWSKVEKLTRSYKLTEQTQKVMEDHLAKVDDKLISLLTLDGQEMHTLPKAIASKNKTM